MKHWTVISADDGEYFIDCGCGWTALATSWDDAVEEARQHKETAA